MKTVWDKFIELSFHIRLKAERLSVRKCGQDFAIWGRTLRVGTAGMASSDRSGDGSILQWISNETSIGQAEARDATSSSDQYR